MLRHHAGADFIGHHHHRRHRPRRRQQLAGFRQDLLVGGAVEEPVGQPQRQAVEQDRARVCAQCARRIAGRLQGAPVGAALRLVAAVAAGLAFGVEHVDLRRALSDRDSTDAAILFGTRVTRVLLGAVVGAALAPAGVAFQALLRNPLADPYVLGVAGGAAVAGTAASLFAGAGALGVWTRPAFAFAGALGAILLVFVFGRARGHLVPHLALLAGVVVN